MLQLWSRVVKIDLISSAEACQRLHVDRSTLMRWVKSGRIEPVHRGTGVRGAMVFNAADVDRLAERVAS